MFKQNLFIILSGIIAGAAIFGWMRPCEENAESNTPAVLTTTAITEDGTTVSPLDASEATSVFVSSHNAMIQALASAAVQSHLDELTQGTKRVPKLKLVSPDTAPTGKVEYIEVPADQIAQKALDVLRNTKDLQTASAIAIFNAADGKLIAETDGAQAQALIDAVKAQPLKSGFQLQSSDSGVLLWNWKCMNEAGNLCVAAAQTNRLKIDGATACRSASSATRILCNDGVSVDGSQLFEASDCENISLPSIFDISTELLKAENSSGILNQWNYAKASLSENCTLISAEQITSVVQENVTVSEAPTEVSGTKPKILPVGIAAVGSALLIILLGFACTRRKEEKSAVTESKTTSSLPNDEEIKKLQANLTAKDSELHKLQEQVKTQEQAKNALDRDYAALKSKASQLEDQLNYARKMHQSHSLTIETLEAENEQLKDKLASNDRVNHTQVQIVPQTSQTVPVLSSAAFEDISEKRSVASTRPLPDMTPARAEALNNLSLNEEAPSSTASKPDDPSSEEELFPDDVWDEIASSFDAILVDKSKVSTPNNAVTNDLTAAASAAQSNGPAALNKPASKIAQALELSDLDLLENEEDKANASLFGMTAFLNGNLNNNRATKKDASQNPATTTSHGLGPVPSQPLIKPAPKAPSLSSVQPIDTLKRIPSLASHSDTHSTDNRAASDNSFKPSPSWTGKKAGETPSKTDAGAISQELVNALQRRAKDVSQLNAAIPHDDSGSLTTKSGALDFSRTMSKSGAFSVTGSRAAIRINSDTEYFKVLYVNYMESLRQHGENTTKFTLEQFISRMAKEKETLIKKYQCKDIRFNIVEKNGKTSLKAIPLR